VKKYTYKDSGVDVGKGEEFARFIKDNLRIPEWLVREPTGYAAVLNFTNPPIAVTADGIGTKLLLHVENGRWRDAAEDLVAMNYNDLVAAGAEPRAFVDYLGVHSINEEQKHFISELLTLLDELGMALVAGETAEMPDIYPNGIWDVAGFAMGIHKRVFDISKVVPGDVVIGISSNGFHSNGWSLIRRIIRENGISLRELDFDLLKGTRIYSNLVKQIENPEIKAMAHVTGGGIVRALKRVLSRGLGARMLIKKRDFLDWILQFVDFEEACSTFNMGWGFLLISSESCGEELAKVVGGEIIGQVTENEGIFCEFWEE